MQDLKIFTTDLYNFEKDVIYRSEDTLILVDFWADWCVPCISISPNLEATVNEMNGSVLLMKVEVDVDENMKLVSEHDIRGFPTIIMFKNREEVARFSGFQSREWIKNWIYKYL
tara:strand:+ start:1181 stop:1522 length:342 start_codon:yes stop_codon:yes gene_type:complete